MRTRISTHTPLAGSDCNIQQISILHFMQNRQLFFQQPLPRLLLTHLHIILAHFCAPFPVRTSQAFYENLLFAP